MMNKKTNNAKYLPWILTASVSLFTGATQARLMVGEGVADSREQAGKLALSDLASQIFVQVESRADVQQSESQGSSYSQNIATQTDLPLMGAKVECYEQFGKPTCQASLETSAATALYLGKMDDEVASLKQELAVMKKQPKGDHYARINRMLQAIDSYEKYRTVLNFFTGGQTTVTSLPASRADLLQQMERYQQQVKSLRTAADVIGQGIGQQNLLIKAPTPQGVNEVTPLGRALYDELQRSLLNRQAKDESGADYVLSGQYEEVKQGVRLSMALKDQTGKTLSYKTLLLDPVAYAQFDPKPQHLDFDALVKHGYVLDNQFRVELTTDKGQRQLHYNACDPVQLLVRANRPTWYYIVGHTQNDKERFSYLLELNGYGQEGSPERFTGKIGAGNLNTYQALFDGFYVIAPFGNETFQLFGSDQPIENRLPKTRAQVRDGYTYYVLVDNDGQPSAPEKAVSTTRGLIAAHQVKKAQGASQPARYSESVLSYQTYSTSQYQKRGCDI